MSFSGLAGLANVIKPESQCHYSIVHLAPMSAKPDFDPKNHTKKSQLKILRFQSNSSLTPISNTYADGAFQVCQCHFDCKPLSKSNQLRKASG